MTLCAWWMAVRDFIEAIQLCHDVCDVTVTTFARPVVALSAFPNVLCILLTYLIEKPISRVQILDVSVSIPVCGREVFGRTVTFAVAHPYAPVPLK